MTPTLFSDLGLSPELEKAVKKLGFEQASPIQAAAIPVLMAGKDVVGQSQTGSGKTAAFGIPAIEKVDPKLLAVQVLVLCPTRELAVQVSEEVHKLAYFKRGVVGLPIYGGQSYERQFAGLKQGAQIVIGTPGRVMDHLRRGTLVLDQLHTIILDEADVMLDMGFREDIETVLSQVPEERQTVFFSATMPRPIRMLIDKFSRDPESIKIEQKTATVPSIEQSYFEVDRRFKLELITRLIDLHDLKLGIIFCNTKAMVEELVEHLVAQGYQADKLHGDMTQYQRDRVMNRFRKSGLEFLVATDVAARGIDVNDVEVVFNYDLPYDPEDYVHRIGRTGRAGRSGLAFSFVSGREIFKIRNIERFTKSKVRRGRLPSKQDVDAARDGHLLSKVREVLSGTAFREQEKLVERLLEEGASSTDIAAALLHLLNDRESNPEKESGRDELIERAERMEGRGRRREGDRDRRGPAGRDRYRDRDRDGGRYRDREGGRDRDREWGRQRPDRRDRNLAARPARGGSDRGPRPVGADRPRRESAAGRVIRMAGSSGPGAPGVSAAGSSAAAPSAAETRPPRNVARDVVAKPERAAPASQESQPAPKPKPAKPAGEAPRSAPSEAKEAKARPLPKRMDGASRLRLNVGRSAGLSANDIRQAMLGETGMSASNIGRVDVQEKHATIEITPTEAKSVLNKMKRTSLGGKRIKAKLV